MARLHHKNVRAPHILQNLKVDFAVAEASQLGLADLHIQMLADTRSQRRIGRAREYFEPVVVQDALAPGSRFTTAPYVPRGPCALTHLQPTAPKAPRQT